MKIEFILKNNRISRKDTTQKLNLAQNDIIIQFDNQGDPLPDTTIYALLKTPDATYRQALNEDLSLTKVPLQLSEHKFFKISLYWTQKEKRATTNELIIPLDRSGWLEYKRPYNNHPKEFYTHENEDCDEDCGEYYSDIFDYILDELKTSINKITIQETKAYGYHNEELVQIIPLPEWVTRTELNNFFGDIVSDIELDEENGDLIVTHKNIRITNN